MVRERVDSPRETWLRLCLVLAGLPAPECNLVIGDDRGPIGRVDLVYLAFKIIIEYEGDQHRTDRAQWNRDIDRHEDFARDHWTLIRVTSERLRWPRQVVRTVHAALISAGYRGPEANFDRRGTTSSDNGRIFESPRNCAVLAGFQLMNRALDAQFLNNVGGHVRASAPYLGCGYGISQPRTYRYAGQPALFGSHDVWRLGRA
jgi:hypothetical protein